MEELNATTIPVIENFIIPLEGKIVLGNLIELDSSYLIWLGTESNPSFSTLEMAMPTRFNELPLTTSLISPLAPTQDSACVGLMQRLSKRFSIQLFLSCNVDLEEGEYFIVERHLFQQISLRVNK